MSCPSATLADALESFTLRPAHNKTSYIEVDTSAPAGSSLVQAIRSAVQGAQSVHGAATRWHAARSGADAASLASWPEANVFAETGLITPGDTTYAYGVRVSLPVYDGGQRARTFDSETAKAKTAGHDADDELTSTIVDLVAALASHRFAEQSLAIFRDQHRALQTIHRLTREETRAGTASQVDLAMIEVELRQNELELASARQNMEEARQTFAGIAGAPPPKIKDMGSLHEHLPKTREDALQTAMARNPRLAASLARALSAEATADATTARSGPAVNLDLSLGGQGGNGSAHNVQGRAVLKFNVPISAGAGATQMKAQLEAQAAHFEAQAAHNGVIAGLDSMQSRLNASRERVRIAKTNQARAKNVLSGVKAEAELGERGLSDILNAETTLTQSRIAYARAQHDLTVSEHLLAAQIGILPEVYGVSLR